MMGLGRSLDFAGKMWAVSRTSVQSGIDVISPRFDGAKGLVENRLHNYLRLCLVAVGKNDVVDSDAPRAVVLL
jgi:hypothetical protein